MALPAQHKKRLIQGIAAYVLAVAAVGGWVFLKAPHAVEEWDSHVPKISAPVIAVAAKPETDPTVAAGDDSPTISIILTDAGMSAQATTQALQDLPKAIAFAFSPYPNPAQALLKKAQEDKRDTLILLPMEPGAYPKDDPGPKALLTRLGEAENKKTLNWVLARGASTIGVMNYMGSRFLTDDKSLLPVFSTLKSKNLFFIEDSALPAMSTAMAAEQVNMTYVAADISLDSTPSEQAIRQQLIELEKRASEKGFALGVAHPYPVTINTLKSWASTLDNRGIRLVTLTEMIKNSAEHEQQPADGKPITP